MLWVHKHNQTSNNTGQTNRCTARSDVLERKLEKYIVWEHCTVSSVSLCLQLDIYINGHLIMLLIENVILLQLCFQQNILVFEV